MTRPGTGDADAWLALDTGSPIVSVAVARGGETIAVEATEIRRSSERLLGMVEAVLGGAGVELRELSGAVALRGPGSFTGLRVGMATLLGLHQAVDLRVGAMPTLRALAESAPDGPRVVTAAVDALRGDWFVETFERPDSGLSSAAGPVRLSGEALGRALVGTVVGFGAESLSPLVGDGARTFHEPEALAPVAAGLAAEWTRFEVGDLLDPLYLRSPAVTPPRSRQRPAIRSS